MDTMTEVFGGVDTHLDTHTAAVINRLNTVVGTASFPVDTTGYQQLRDWMRGHGQVVAVGVEGTGSYGAGLTRFLLADGLDVREVTRPNRQHRRRHGKSDHADAVAAAVAVAGNTATGTPRCPDGPVEAARNLRTARNLAVNTRTRILNQAQALVVTAPAQLREQLSGQPTHRMLASLVDYQPTDVSTPHDAALTALAALAALNTVLTKQIDGLTRALDKATRAAAPPALFDICGVGPVVAADLIIAAGTNPARLHSEPAFAALCGVSAVDASSGKQQRHRLNRGGDRQANSALYRAVIVSLRYHQPTKDYMQRRLAEGKTKREIIRCLKRHLARRVYKILTTKTT
jgi:transposase